MNIREQIINFLLGVCDQNQLVIAALQKQIAELEKQIANIPVRTENTQ